MINDNNIKKMLNTSLVKSESYAAYVIGYIYDKFNRQQEIILNGNIVQNKKDIEKFHELTKMAQDLMLYIFQKMEIDIKEENLVKDLKQVDLYSNILQSYLYLKDLIHISDILFSNFLIYNPYIHFINNHHMMDYLFEIFDEKEYRLLIYNNREYLLNILEYLIQHNSFEFLTNRDYNLDYNIEDDHFIIYNHDYLNINIFKMPSDTSLNYIFSILKDIYRDKYKNIKFTFK